MTNDESISVIDSQTIPDNEAISSEEISEATAEKKRSQKFQDKEPVELIQYIENFITVTLLGGLCYNGFVHSIDPVSYSIILSVPVAKEERKFKTIVISGSAVKKIDITQTNQNIKPVQKQIDKLSTADLQLKKTKVLSWLKKNGLVVTVDEDIIQFAGVILLPPYGEKDICTTNPVVALEIKKLIGRMPMDYVPT